MKSKQINTISKKQLEKAISNNLGIKTLTAKELKICRVTLNRYIEKYDLSEFLEDQKEEIRDLVRLNIIEAIKNGDLKVSLWYAERQMFEEFGNSKQIQENYLKQENSIKITNENRITKEMTATEASEIYKELIRQTKGE